MINPGSTIGPVQFAHLIGTSLESIRDWRRRGFNFGKEVQPRQYEYTKADLLHAGLMVLLNKKYNLTMEEAYRQSMWIAPHLADQFGLTEADIPLRGLPGCERPKRFAVFEQSANPVFDDSVQSALLLVTDAVVTVYDIRRLADQLPDDLWFNLACKIKIGHPNEHLER